MNLSRCENGHFYDKDKYSSCPHCSGGGSDDALTAVFTEGDATEAMEAPQPVNSFPTAPMVGGGFPTSAFDADTPTEELADDIDTPTVSKVTEPMPTTDLIPDDFDSDDDFDKTVAFFDDVFTDTPAKAAEEKAAPEAPKAKHVVNKVKTPCVGWLIALGGAHLGTDFRLKVGKNFIGRSPSMDVALTEDKSVSRDRHAVVVYEPKEHMYIVQPGEASTLVYKNEQVVLTPEILKAYDVITVGDVNLLFIPLCNKEFNWNQVLEELKSKGQI